MLGARSHCRMSVMLEQGSSAMDLIGVASDLVRGYFDPFQRHVLSFFSDFLPIEAGQISLTVR